MSHQIEGALLDRIVRRLDSIPTKPTERARKHDGTILFIDALGVKGLQARVDPREFLHDWELTVERVVWAIENYKLQEYQLLNHRMISFSDTIIICAWGKRLDLSIAILSDCFKRIICEALSCGILLRGSLSIGEFYETGHMIVGPALDDAYAWESAMEMVGIALTPQASMRCMSAGWVEGVLKGRVFPWEVPIKGNEHVSLLTVPWPLGFGLHPTPPDNKSKSRLLAGLSRQATSPEVARKVANSLAYAEKVLCLQSIPSEPAPSSRGRHSQRKGTQRRAVEGGQ